MGERERIEKKERLRQKRGERAFVRERERERAREKIGFERE